MIRYEGTRMGLWRFIAWLGLTGGLLAAACGHGAGAGGSGESGSGGAAHASSSGSTALAGPSSSSMGASTSATSTGTSATSTGTSSVSGSSSGGGAVTPDQDYANRCAAAGVLTCQGFDDSSVFDYSPSQTQGLYPPYGTTTVGGFQDASVKASGKSSLRFDIEDHTSADVAGNFSWDFGKNFSQHSTFYVQFRARFDSTFVNTDWDQVANSSPKLETFYDGNDVPCSKVELTTVEYYGGGMPRMYSDCGVGITTSPTSITTYQSDAMTPYLWQQGSSATSGYNCEYHNEVVGTGNGVGCLKYVADTWMTFYYKVSLGTWGSPDTSVQAWIATNGGPYQQWTNVANLTLQSNGSPSAGFNRVQLLPYMTGKSTSATYPTSHVWYDELIVSTQPIAAPQ